MKVLGAIKLIDETQTIGNNGFQKRELVIVTEEQYPQHLLIEFVQNKCALLDNFLEGQSVEVSINLKGREWVNPQGETKYFNSIQGWKIEAINDAATQQAVDRMPPPPDDPFEGASLDPDEDHDDLPF